MTIERLRLRSRRAGCAALVVVFAAAVPARAEEPESASLAEAVAAEEAAAEAEVLEGEAGGGPASPDWERAVELPDLRERERVRTRLQEAEDALARERAAHRRAMDELARRYEEQIRQERRQAEEVARRLRDEVERLRSEIETRDALSHDQPEQRSSPNPSLIRRREF